MGTRQVQRPQLDTACLGHEAWVTSFPWSGLQSPTGHHWAAQSSVLPPGRSKGHFPRRAGPPGVPWPAQAGNPAAEQMAGRFFLPRHPVRGRQGGLGCRLPCEPGLEPLRACPDMGPHPGWPGGACRCPMCPQGGLGGRKFVPCSPGADSQGAWCWGRGETGLGGPGDWKFNWGRWTQRAFGKESGL